MTDFTFYSPTYFVFGRDQERLAGEMVIRFGGQKVLVHYGGGSAVRSGLLERIFDSLQAVDMSYVSLGGVQPNPRSGLVYEGIELCKQEEVDFILAVGGGSVIDSAKAIAAGALYKGDFWDFFEGRRIERALPIGTVLTIAAAGSEGSPNCVITKEPEMLKRGSPSDALRPRFSILNPALTCSLPPYQTACGVTDILAHLYERYLTRTHEVEATDRLIEGLMMTVIHEGRRVMAEPDNYDVRANLMWSGTLAHNNVCGVGRTQDWSSHKLEHELSALYGCAHGAGLAVVMPAVLRYELPRATERLAQVAERVWDCPRDAGNLEATAMAGIQALQAFLKSLGMPDTFAALGAREEDIPTLAHNCCWGGKNADGKVHGLLDLDEATVAAIYRDML